MTCPDWCIDHPDLEPDTHLGLVYCTGWAVALEQRPGEAATVHLPEDAATDTLTAADALNLATALHATARTLQAAS